MTTTNQAMKDFQEDFEEVRNQYEQQGKLDAFNKAMGEVVQAAIARLITTNPGAMDPLNDRIVDVFHERFPRSSRLSTYNIDQLVEKGVEEKIAAVVKESIAKKLGGADEALSKSIEELIGKKLQEIKDKL